MRKKIITFTTVLILLTAVSCQKKEEPISSKTNTNGNNSVNPAPASYTPYESGMYFSSIEIPTPDEIEEPTITNDFTLTTSDGDFTVNNNIYTINAAGSYTASGSLNGQIVIDAGDDDEVELVLNNASIIYDKDSAIKGINADKLEIKANSGTKNLVKDTRALKTVDNEEVGEGVINAKMDLKLKGTGTLVVSGTYNNGVHTSDDLEIQKLTVQSTAPNNAFKGNDSITINSGVLYAYSSNGQGFKTKNTDVSSKGNQRGSIEINGGTIYIDSLYDALDASYNVDIIAMDNGVALKVYIKAGTKSSFYNASTFDKEASAKGIKAENEINIYGGTIAISASDDAIHANYGETFDNGETGLGNITIGDGHIQIASGDDGLHADNTLTISGGEIAVTGATEGFEANHIKISGGYSHIYGTDDGVNASKKINQTPTVEVTGGVLDVAVTSGDTDGIDSNGSYTQSGGLVISRGSYGNGSNMSTGLDCDGTASITGGTFIAFNGMEKTPSLGSGVLKAATNYSAQGGIPGGGPGGPGPRRATTTYSFAAGNYVLSGGEISISFTNNYSYSGFMIYSSLLKTNTTYTLTKDETTVLSWTQSSGNVTIE